MRYILEPTNLKILLEENDRGRVAVYPDPPIITVQYGYTRGGVTVWDDKEAIPQVPRPEVNLLRDFKLDSRVLYEHRKNHPFDLYSIVDPDPEPDVFSISDASDVAHIHDVSYTSEVNDEDPPFVPEVEEEKEKKKEESPISIQTTRASKSKIWTITGKGKHANVNKVRIDLRNLPARQATKYIGHLQQLRRTWNKRQELVPVVQNLTRLVEHVRGDPKCEFSITKDGDIKVTYRDKTQAIPITANRWAIYDALGRKSELNLNKHPDRVSHQFMIGYLEDMWRQNKSLVPVLHKGVWQKEGWVAVPESAESETEEQQPKAGRVRSRTNSSSSAASASTRSSRSRSTLSSSSTVSSCPSNRLSQTRSPTETKHLSFRAKRVRRLSSSTSSQSDLSDQPPRKRMYSTSSVSSTTDQMIQERRRIGSLYDNPVQSGSGEPYTPLFPVLASNFDLINGNSRSTQKSRGVSRASSASSRGQQVLDTLNEASDRIDQARETIQDLLQQAVNEAGVPALDQLRADWSSESDDE